MLKIIPPTTSCGCGYFKSKCAEIHYQTSDFSILCIFCGMTTLSYTDFVEHFQSHHFDDFARTMQSTAEPVVTTIYEESATASKRTHHADPLEFGDREITENSEELMKTEVGDNIQMTSESPADFLSSSFEQAAKIHCDDEEFNESDDEYLICKVKVEESDLHAANPSKPRKPYKPPSVCNSAPNLEENEAALHNENFRSDDYPKQTSDCEDDNDDNYNNSDASKPPTDEEDIDWAKPYEPNLLKNHEKRPYKPRNKPNICSYCGRTFRRRYQLDTHLNIHTGSKPHQCDVCGRLFRAVTTLTRHLNTHEEREAYKCKFCAKSFTHKAALLSHELRHTQERSVPCDECDKLFYTVNQMDTHKRKVHHKADDAALPFACDLCTKRYRSASMLSTHKFKKHYKTAKFSCEQCGKKFIDDQQLNTHKLIHVDRMTNSKFKNLL